MKAKVLTMVCLAALAAVALTTGTTTDAQQIPEESRVRAYAVIYSGPDCPQCEALIRAVANSGWSVGTEGRHHFYVAQAPDLRQLVPYVEFHVGPQVVARIDGYSGNTREVLNTYRRVRDGLNTSANLTTRAFHAAYDRDYLGRARSWEASARDQQDAANCNASRAMLVQWQVYSGGSAGSQYAPYSGGSAGSYYAPQAGGSYGSQAGGSAGGAGGGGGDYFNPSAYYGQQYRQPYYAPQQYQQPYYAPQQQHYGHQHYNVGGGAGQMICGPNGCYYVR